MSRRAISEAPNRIQVVLNQDRREQLKPQLMPNSMKKEKPAVPQDDKYSDIVKELNKLIGLANVKEFVHEIYALLHMAKCRQEAGLLTNQQMLHMVFKGNPGTGKTTVARLMGKMFKEMGVLSKGHLVEAERADLVGEYIGHTAQKTRDLVKKSLGGILFIDEAYSLSRGGEKDFGKEAVDTLVKSMEDYRNDFVLILAGYTYEMETFLQSNPGLPSRFPIQLTYHDYALDELLQIADLMLEERQYEMSVGAKYKLKQHLLIEMNSFGRHFSNARFVRNIIERAIRHHAVRLFSMSGLTRQELMTIEADDLVEKNTFH